MIRLMAREDHLDFFSVETRPYAGKGGAGPPERRQPGQCRQGTGNCSENRCEEGWASGMNLESTLKNGVLEF